MLVAVVLAAGAGTRFAASARRPAAHKLRSEIGGASVLSRAVAAASDAEVGPVVVVTGQDDYSDLLSDRVTSIVNPRWSEGIATSIQVGVAHAETAGAEGVIVGLGDQPGIGVDAWRRVAAAPAGPVVIADFAGRLRPPVRLDRDVWPLLPTTGDSGARILMRRRPDLVQTVDCVGDPDDIDTVEDLDRWN